MTDYPTIVSRGMTLRSPVGEFKIGFVTAQQYMDWVQVVVLMSSHVENREPLPNEIISGNPYIVCACAEKFFRDEAFAVSELVIALRNGLFALPLVVEVPQDELDQYRELIYALDEEYLALNQYARDWADWLKKGA